jgi:tetratricopeptide (TPR) repeat protein
LLGLGLVVGGLWLRSEQKATAQGVEEDLREVARWRQESDWARAAIALERARGRLGRGGPAVLHQVVEQARRDLDRARREQRLVTQLDAIHLNRMTLVEGRFNHEAERRFNNARADRDYERSFREGLFGAPYDDPKGVAAQVAASAARGPMVAGLDDWAVCATDKRRQAWVFEVARRADPDAWRDRVRDPVAWGDQAALARLARTTSVAEQPVNLLTALGERLHATGGDGIGFLERVRQVYPSDFWTNLTLGKAQQEKRDTGAAIACYREALKFRSDAPVVSNNLGLVWYSMYALPEAMESYQQALRIDPRFAPAHNNLGLALKSKGELAQAIGHYREALAFDPELAPAHANLGEARAGMGELDGAIGHYERALRIEPGIEMAQAALGQALLALGRFGEAEAATRRCLDRLPQNHKLRANVSAQLRRCARLRALHVFID